MYAHIYIRVLVCYPHSLTQTSFVNATPWRAFKCHAIYIHLKPTMRNEFTAQQVVKLMQT